ncbi:MAG: DUF2231 domain-containing protein [Phycisphaerae bacterium]
MGPGVLHLLVLHFPIALIMAALLADALWLITRKAFFRAAGFYCIILGALSAIPTVITGDMLSDSMQFSGDRAALLETHEGLGITTMIVALVAASWRLVGSAWLARGTKFGWWPHLYGLLIVAAGVLVTLTGHWGGMLLLGPDYLKGIF